MNPHNSKLQLLLQDNSPTTPTTTFLTPPPPSLQLYPNPPFDLAMALIVLILLTALFLLGFFSLYICHFASSIHTNNNNNNINNNNPSPQNSFGRHWTHQTTTRRPTTVKGLDPEAVNSLPVYGFYGGEAKYNIDCPICLGEFEEKEMVKMIPYCQHVFHLDCIDMWLVSHVTCPVCRGTQLFVNKSGLCERSTVGEGDTCREIIEEV